MSKHVNWSLLLSLLHVILQVGGLKLINTRNTMIIFQADIFKAHTDRFMVLNIITILNCKFTGNEIDKETMYLVHIVRPWWYFIILQYDDYDNSTGQ